MKLYVANTTKQDHEFSYRVIGIDRLFQQPVPSGRQILVYKDDDAKVIQGIIDQHEPYGLTKVDGIDRRKPFIGMCYSVDKEIPLNKIMYVVEHNDDALAEQGLRNRTEAAAALSDRLNRSTGGKLNDLEVEVIEHKQQGDTSKGFRQVIAVPKQAGSARQVKAARGGRPRKTQ